MALEIDLKEYCSPATLRRGVSLHKTRGISSPSCVQGADSSWILQGKSIDSFNFVSHPRLVTDGTGRKLLDFGCDCLEFRQKQELCEHCVSLCLAWMDQIPTLEPAAPVVPLIPSAPAVTPAPKPAVESQTAVEETPWEEAFKAAAPPEAEKPEEEPAEEPKEEPQEEVKEEIRSMEILLGTDREGNEVLWRPNDTEQVFHTNMGIIGTMGTGKTQFAKSLLTQLYLQQANNYDGHPLGILIFDYKGDYNETKQDFVKATKARVLKPYRLPYNPLALHPGKAFKPLLPMHTANEFKDTISQIYGLGPKQQHLLLECIIKAYRNRGIDPADPMTWSRQAPTIDQVYDILAEETQGRPADKLVTAMTKLHQFCLFEDNPRRAVSLEKLLNGVVVIDISGYDSDIQHTIVAITLNQFYARMHAQGSSRTDGRYRQLRKFIMVDEADTFMGENFPSLRRIMKEGREFGVGVVLSTQSLDHYFEGAEDYSRYVLTWVVHNVGDLKQKNVEYLFRLQPKDPAVARHYAAIKGLQKHESLVKLGNENPISIQNKPFYQLYQQIQG